MKIIFKREYFLILILIYLIFLIFQIKPKSGNWEKKTLPLDKEEIKEVTRYTKDFSFIETKDEKTLFEIYAKEVLAQKDTSLSLKDVIMTFYIKEGTIKINCKSAKFDIESKNAEITGNVIVKFPNGLNLWTENIFYQHLKGALEGPIPLNISYKDFIGKLNKIKINVFEENFSIEDLELQSSNCFIFLPLVEGNVKKSSFFSKSNSYLIYDKNILTFDKLSLDLFDEKIYVKGNCFSGNFNDVKNYVFFSEKFEGEFLSKNFQPIIFKFYENIQAYGIEEIVSIKADLGILYYDSKKPSTFHLEGAIEIEKNEDRVYCNVINAYFRNGKIENVFFGDYVILCFKGWYITCGNMNYIPKNDILMLSGSVISSKGYLKTNSNWMKITNRGEVIIFGDGIKMEESNKGLNIKAKECTLEEKIKKADFRENVIAWTKDYTLKSKRLEMFEGQLIARNNAEFLGIKDDNTFSLNADEININQKEEKLSALGPIIFKWENYIMNGYFLQVFRKENKIDKFILTDQVKFYTVDKKQSGSSELLEIHPQKNLIILEGCPAVLEDELQGKIEANILFIIKEPPEIFIIDEKRGKITYKKNQ